MGNAVPLARMRGADFLAWEAEQAERHEFVNGEVFAMAGAEDRHVAVVGNLFIALRNGLRATPCRVYMMDMKLLVEATGSYFYPDLLVTCSAADRADRLVKREPTLLVEVLSASTAANDRGFKFEQYRRLPSLAEYALIDIATRRADVFRKGADGLWVLHPFEPGETVTLASAQTSIAATELFADID